MMYTMAFVLAGGVCQRFPELKIVFERERCDPPRARDPESQSHGAPATPDIGGVAIGFAVPVRTSASHSRSASGSVTVNEYKVGTLVTDIFDSKSKALLWRGTNTLVLDAAAGSEPWPTLTYTTTIAALQRTSTALRFTHSSQLGHAPAD